MKKILAIVLVIALSAGCAMRPSPEAAYANIVKAAENKDWGAVYDSFDNYSKGQMDAAMKMLASFAVAFSDEATAKELESLSGKDLFIRMAESEMGADTQDIVTGPDYTVVQKEVAGDRAILTIKDGKGNFEEVNMVFENKKWKLHLEEISEAEQTPKKKLTLSEKIERQKQEKLAEEARKKEEAAQKALKQAVQVALVDKGFIASDWSSSRYEDYLTLKIVLSNQTDKDIAAVKGVIVFKDVFGDDILRVSFKQDDGIPAKSEVTWSGTIDYNQFNDNHEKLRNTELENLTLDWEPQVILFKDGSKLEL